MARTLGRRKAARRIEGKETEDPSKVPAKGGGRRERDRQGHYGRGPRGRPRLRLRRRRRPRVTATGCACRPTLATATAAAGAAPLPPPRVRPSPPAGSTPGGAREQPAPAKIPAGGVCPSRLAGPPRWRCGVCQRRRRPRPPPVHASGAPGGMNMDCTGGRGSRAGVGAGGRGQSISTASPPEAQRAASARVGGPTVNPHPGGRP